MCGNGHLRKREAHRVPRSLSCRLCWSTLLRSLTGLPASELQSPAFRRGYLTNKALFLLTGSGSTCSFERRAVPGTDHPHRG